MRKVFIRTKYNIGDIIYLRTDDENNARIVTGITIRPNNSIIYEVSCGTVTSSHYDFEMSNKY